LVHDLCENGTAAVQNTRTLKDKADIPKHRKPHTEFWVLPIANAELQRRAEADVLVTVPRCTSVSTRRIDSMNTAEHTQVCRSSHHDGSYPQHLQRGQHLVPCMVLSAAVTAVQ